MRLERLVCGSLRVNTYIIGGETTDDCMVIDPGEAAPVIDYLKENQLNCTHILLTHGHFDHIGGVRQVKDAFHAKVCIHALDEPALHSSLISLALILGGHMEEVDADFILQDGETVRGAGLELRVLHTPGHTMGGVCYLIEKDRVIFSGDTLFKESYGRTDLPNGSDIEMKESILTKLFSLDGEYMVYPGHGESTTLLQEQQCNPIRFLNV